MTNYETYPIWRLRKNSCIICFSNYQYSWCELTYNQMIYLLESEYFKGAFQIDIKPYGGLVMHLTENEFRNYLNLRLKDFRHKKKNG